MPRPIRKGQLVNSINHFDSGFIFVAAKRTSLKHFKEATVGNILLCNKCICFAGQCRNVIYMFGI